MKPLPISVQSQSFTALVGLFLFLFFSTAFTPLQLETDKKTAVREALVNFPVGYFRLKNAKSGKYLAIGAGDPNQKNAIQWADVKQKDITWASDGQRIWNAQTGGVIGAKNATDNLVEHKQLGTECETENPQYFKWDMVKQTNGTVLLVNKTFKTYLSIEAGATSDGNKAIFYKQGQWQPLATVPKECFWYLEPVFISKYKLSVKLVATTSEVAVVLTHKLVVGSFC